MVFHDEEEAESSSLEHFFMLWRSDCVALLDWHSGHPKAELRGMRPFPHREPVEINLGPGWLCKGYQHVRYQEPMRLLYMPCLFRRL